MVQMMAGVLTCTKEKLILRNWDKKKVYCSEDCFFPCGHLVGEADADVPELLKKGYKIV
jgi:hypothetical protein